MTRNRRVCGLIWLLCLIGGGLRFWNLDVAVDGFGLPLSGQPSTLILILFSLLMVVPAFLFGRSSVVPDGKRHVMTFTGSGFAVSLVGAVLLFVGAMLSAGECLLFGGSTASLLMCMLGIVSAVCLMVVAYVRRSGKGSYPVAHLIPIVYLILKLILNFKDWSTDPVVLDYCFIFFALVFTLLAVYHGVGFLFDAGKPRRVFFHSFMAIYFCALATVEALVEGSLSTAVNYMGFLLWLWPSLWAVLKPDNE